MATTPVSSSTNSTWRADRPLLGLRFEEGLRKPYASALRLPPWFSNLLPEGPLRQWIADERGVSLDREMELLAQVGHDLPGAVQVCPTDGPDMEVDWSTRNQGRHAEGSVGTLKPVTWRFSLAGVALKFSMLAQGDRLTVPAVHDRGDWLVKFPDYRYSDVPSNEYAMMKMARAVGMDVPEVRLVHRDALEGLPARMWPNAEQWAFAVKRFDRSHWSRGCGTASGPLPQISRRLRLRPSRKPSTCGPSFSRCSARARNSVRGSTSGSRGDPPG